MAKDPAFLFYPGDYLRDTQCLSEKAQVAYDRIMCEHMRNICKDVSKIGITKDKLNFFTKRLTDDEKNDLMHVLEKSGEIFQIEWVALSICKRKAYSDNRAKNRLGKNQKDMKTYDSHMENANEIVNEYENINAFGTEKKNDMSKNNNTSEIPLPFLGPAFSEKWNEWIEFRRQRRLPQYVPIGLKGTFTKLKRISYNDEEMAIAIIQQSMDDNYQGLFPLKKEINGTHQQRVATIGQTFESDR